MSLNSIIDLFSRIFHGDRWIRKAVARKKCEDRINAIPSKKYENFLIKKRDEAKERVDSLSTPETISTMIESDDRQTFEQVRNTLKEANEELSEWSSRLQLFYDVVRGDYDE